MSAARSGANDCCGFGYGTDSNGPDNTSTSTPYANTFTWFGHDTDLGGQYRGYFGTTGGYSTTLGCATFTQWNTTNVNKAYDNFNSSGIGIGAVMLWWLGGPGRDPAYDPSTYTNTKAYNWGKTQADDTLTAWGNHPKALLTLVFADMEGTAEGWNEWLYPNCSNSTHTCGGGGCTINPSFDINVIDGWQDELANAGLSAGVYGSYYFWNQATFGCGACGSGTGYIPNIYKWTYGDQVTQNPSGSFEPVGNWTVSGSNGASAVWFGGGAADGSGSYEVAWQWAANHTPTGDFDQIAVDRVRTDFHLG